MQQLVVVVTTECAASVFWQSILAAANALPCGAAVCPFDSESWRQRALCYVELPRDPFVWVLIRWCFCKLNVVVLYIAKNVVSGFDLHVYFILCQVLNYVAFI